MDSNPGTEFVGADDPNRKGHQRVIEPAELAAFATKGTALIRRPIENVLESGDCVALEEKRRYPKRMVDVD